LNFVNQLTINQLRKQTNACFEVAKIDNCIGCIAAMWAVIMNKQPLIFFSC